jgi:predicted esterase
MPPSGGGGFSNGANIAATLLFRHPRLLRGAVLFAPMVTLDDPPMVDLSGVGVFLGAGRADRIAPPEQAERLAVITWSAGSQATRVGAELVIDSGDLRHRWAVVVGHDRRSWRTTAVSDLGQVPRRGVSRFDA